MRLTSTRTRRFGASQGAANQPIISRIQRGAKMPQEDRVNGSIVLAIVDIDVDVHVAVPLL